MDNDRGSCSRRPGLRLHFHGRPDGETESLGCRNLGREDGAPPLVDLTAERKHGDFVRGEIAAGHISVCHDLSDGGLLVALAEMAMAGGMGATIACPASIPAHAFLFGEDQGRYILLTPNPDMVKANAEKAGIPSFILGLAGGDALTVAWANAISVAVLKRINEAWLPSFMEG